MKPMELFGVTIGGGPPTWSDERLVEECLKGNEAAWSALVDKYKSLIFSVPVRFGLSHDESTDVFQEVCYSLLSELRELRQPRALPAWLAHTAWHKCMHYARQKRRFVELSGDDERNSSDKGPLPEKWMQDIECEQTLRDAIGELQPRCGELIRLLFFSNPPVPYQEVAQRLGLATGSIGFIRMRCLDRLRDTLQKRGFR